MGTVLLHCWKKYAYDVIDNYVYDLSIQIYSYIARLCSVGTRPICVRIYSYSNYRVRFDDMLFVGRIAEFQTDCSSGCKVFCEALQFSYGIRYADTATHSFSPQ